MDRPARPSTWLRRGGGLIGGTLGPLVALLLVFLVFAVADRLQAGGGHFATAKNVENIVVQSATVAMAALGMTIIIISGGIDLSAGTALALCATVLAWGLREDVASMVYYGDNFASASRKVVQIDAAIATATAESDRAALGRLRSERARRRERLQTIAAAKLDTARGRLERSSGDDAHLQAARETSELEEKIRQLRDPTFTLSGDPRWIENVPNSPYTPALAVALGIGTGLATGFFNGLLISALRVVPFIVTLGTMTIYLGAAKLVGESTVVRPGPSQVPDWMNDLLSTKPQPEWLLFSPGIWLLLGGALFVAAMLRYTVFGRHVFAIGSSEPTARLCGISVPRTRVAVYTLAGLFVALAGLYQFSRISSGNPTSGSGKELLIIAAVVIGGGSLSGGRASVLGTLTGALIMQVIDVGCTTLRLPNPIQEIMIGAIIIVAVTVDQFRQRRLAQ